MKNIILLILLFIASFAYSQIDVNTGYKSEGLSTAELNALPAAIKDGLIIKDTTLNTIVAWNGTQFIEVGGSVTGNETLAEVLTQGNTANMEIDLNGNNLDNINFARFNDTDSDIANWTIQEITNANYTGDLAFGLSGVYRYALDQSGTPTQPFHLITKGYADANYNGTDDQTLSISGNDLSISGGNSVTLPSGGTGDVVGPSSSINNTIARFDGTTGKLIQGSGISISDTDQVDFNFGDLVNARSLTTNVSVSTSFLTSEDFRAIPKDIEPASVEGSYYWDDSENRLKGHDGTSWKTFLLDGDVAGVTFTTELSEDLSPVLSADLDANGQRLNNVNRIQTDLIVNNLNPDIVLAPTGHVDVSNNRVIGLGDPVNVQDAVNLRYFNANVGVIADGSITTAKILDDTILEADLANGSVTTDKLDARAVTLAKMFNMSANSVIGNIGSFGSPEYISFDNLTDNLIEFNSTEKGVVPLSGGGTNNFLRADGTWAEPPSSGGGLTSQQLIAFNNLVAKKVVYNSLNGQTTVTGDISHQLATGADEGATLVNLVSDASDVVFTASNTDPTELDKYHLETHQGKITILSPNGFIGIGFTGNAIELTDVAAVSIIETGVNSGTFRIFEDAGADFVTYTPPSACTADPNEAFVTANSASDPNCNEIDGVAGVLIFGSITLGTSTDASVGTHSLRAQQDATGTNFIYIDLPDTGSYTLTYDIKQLVGSGGSTAAINVNGGTGTTVTTSWTSHTQNLLANGAASFRFNPGGNGNVIAVDNISLITN